MKPGIQYHCPACEQDVEMGAQRFADLMKHQQWPCERCEAPLQVEPEDQPRLQQRIGQYRQQATKHLLPMGLLLSTIVLHLNEMISNELLALGFALSFVGLLWVRKLKLPVMTLKAVRRQP
ncbi:hypothetical protein KUV89_18660 [Marinobacter hydrocarbonoclasticus]|nr:hypothetical protein [Marinobacter nauticus]